MSEQLTSPTASDFPDGAPKGLFVGSYAVDLYTEVKSVWVDLA